MPRIATAPLSACTVNSVAGRSAYGPVKPYGVTETTMVPGRSAAICVGLPHADDPDVMITSALSSTSAGGSVIERWPDRR